MDQQHINVSDVFFQRRWSVLRSVDDMVVRLDAALQAAGVAEETFFIFSSDHVHMIRYATGMHAAVLPLASNISSGVGLSTPLGFVVLLTYERGALGRLSAVE